MEEYMDFQKQFQELMGNKLSQSTYWITYSNLLTSMSTEQRKWISQQKEVLEAKQSMYSSFLDYLFEKFKDEFVSVGNGQYKAVADSYIETIKKASESYVSRVEWLEKEYLQQKEELERLRNSSKAVSNTEYGRKNDSKLNIGNSTTPSE